MAVLEVDGEEPGKGFSDGGCVGSQSSLSPALPLLGFPQTPQAPT